MKYRVLKELPQGNEPGTTVDLGPEIAAALMLVGAVEPFEEPKTEPVKQRGRYRRTDLQPETRDLTPAD